MNSLHKWLPAFACALVWAGVNGLLQPWLSRAGVLLFTDAALLLVPARFFPRLPAVLTVLFGALAADAFRPGPFGLSATLLLPVLLLALPFQKAFRTKDWGEGVWLAAAAAVNSATLAVASAVWTLRMRPAAAEFPALEWQDAPLASSLEGLVLSASASAGFILLFGRWFTALQLAALRLAGNDVREENDNPRT
jgi:hypothetical protein